ncbi:MAG: SDR family oxidoreductase [Gemmatimonadota bacterium]
MSLDVLVAGSAGTLGREVTRELLSRGHRVRAMVHRTPLPPDLAERVRVLPADAASPNGIGEACRGADVVFSCVGASVDPQAFSRRRSYQSVDTPANLNLLREAERAGAGRFVYVGVAGHEELAHLRYVRAHEAVAEALRASSLPYAVIRPTGFFAAFAEFLAMAEKGPVAIIGDGSARTNPIHEADVATVCADAIEGADGERTVGGPQVMTRRKVVELGFQALGRPVRIRSLPVVVARGMAAVMRPLHPRMGDFVRFAADVFSNDLIAPACGERRLVDYLGARAGVRAGD